MNLTERLLKRETTLLWLLIGLYFVVFSGICLWKYGLFGYDGLDLAIYNQAFWNTLHGRPFELSIHPHSYLGDHAEFGLLALLPIYALKADPRTLLVLQTAVLALSAWPIWRLAKEKFGNSTDYSRLYPLVFATAWLLNPLVHNINLFEFHLLPFALPFLLLTLLAYRQRRAGLFVVWSLAAMMFREDVAFVVAAVGLLAIIERRDWRWIAGPLALGTTWFLTATQIAAHYSNGGSYKYLAYYSWLGATDSFVGLLGQILGRPLEVLVHLLSFGNLEMLLGFILPLVLLPLFALGPLVLLLGPLAQILLGAPGGSSVVLQTHYATLFLPGLFLAAMDGLPKLVRLIRRYLPRWRAQTAGIILLLLGSTYGAIVLGPLPAVAHEFLFGTMYLEASDARHIVSQVPDGAPVAASYRLLPHLSSRLTLHSAHYLFLGVTQFGVEPYPTPEDNELLALDENDLATWRAQFLATAWTRPYYPGGRERLSWQFGPAQVTAGQFALYGPPWSSFAAEPKIDGLPETIDPPTRFADGTELTALTVRTEPNGDESRLLMMTTWELGPTPPDSLRVELTVTDLKGHEIWQETLPLIGELWQLAEPGSTYERQIDRPLPRLNDENYRLTIGLVAHDELHTLDGLRSTRRTTIDELPLGQTEVDFAYNE